MCIYHDFSHVEIVESASKEFSTPQEVLLRMLFFRLDDSGSDEKLVSPYCKHCGSGPITEQLCPQSIVCHDVIDAADKKTGEKMLCRDCTKWLQPWLGKTKEKAEAAESDRQLNFLPDVQASEPNMNQTPQTTSDDRGRKRNRNNLHPSQYRPEDWFSDEVRLFGSSATPSSPSAGSRLTNDAPRNHDDGNPRRRKRARVMPHGSRNVRSLTGFDARHGIGRRLSSSQSERPRPSAPGVRRAPNVTREASRQPALSSNTYRPARDSALRSTANQASTPIKQEPAAAEASAEVPGLDRVHATYKDNASQSSNRLSRSKRPDDSVLENCLRSGHESLLSAANAHSNPQGAMTMGQASVDIDDELTHAIRDGSFKRATEAQFPCNRFSPDAVMEEMVKKNMRVIPPLKLRGGTAGHHTPSETRVSPPMQHQTTTAAAAAAARSSSSTVPPQQPAGAPPTPFSTQPTLQPTISPSSVVCNAKPSYDQLLAQVRALQEDKRRLRAANFAKDDLIAVLSKQNAELETTLVESQRREARM